MFAPFFLGFATVTFILVMDFLLDYLKLILEKGVAVGTVIKLFALSLGWMLALSIPCGILVGMLMTFGRMAQDNEILAMRSSGVSLGRLFAPAFAWGIFWTIALGLFNNFVLPWSNHELARLLLEISQKKPTAKLEEGRFIDDFTGRRILFDELDTRKGEITGVHILDYEGRRLNTTVAERGRLTFDPARRLLVLELEDGRMLGVPDDAPDPATFRQSTFGLHRVTFGGELDDDDASRRGRGIREMTAGQLRSEIEKLEERAAAIREEQATRLLPLGYSGFEELGAFLHPPRPWYDEIGAILRGDRSPSPQADAPRFVGPPEVRVVENYKMAEGQIESYEKRSNQHRVEYHKKFSISVACCVFVLLGAPLGTVAKRGGIRAGFLSVVFLLFYYLCLIGGEQLADRRLLWPWLSMWLANIVLGGVGLYIALRVADFRPWRRS